MDTDQPGKAGPGKPSKAQITGFQVTATTGYA